MRATSAPQSRENQCWEWELSESSAGRNRTDVLFRNYGFYDGYPEHDFGRIAQTWARILDRLSAYITTGSPQPYFPASDG